MDVALNLRGGSNFDLESVMAQASKDPVSAVHMCRETFASGARTYRAQLYGTVAAVYGIAMRLDDDRHSWKKFLNDEYSRNAKRKPQEDDGPEEVLRHLIFFVFENTNGYDRAWKYFRAMKRLLDEGVEYDRVVERIHAAGGLEALVTGKKGKVPNPARGEGDAAADADISTANGKTRSATLPILEVELAPASLDRLLASEEGRRVKLIVKNEESLH